MAVLEVTWRDEEVEPRCFDLRHRLDDMILTGLLRLKNPPTDIRNGSPKCLASARPKLTGPLEPLKVRSRHEAPWKASPRARWTRTKSAAPDYLNCRSLSDVSTGVGVTNESESASHIMVDSWIQAVEERLADMRAKWDEVVAEGKERIYPITQSIMDILPNDEPNLWGELRDDFTSGMGGIMGYVETTWKEVSRTVEKRCEDVFTGIKTMVAPPLLAPQRMPLYRARSLIVPGSSGLSSMVPSLDFAELQNQSHSVEYQSPSTERVGGGNSECGYMDGRGDPGLEFYNGIIQRITITIDREHHPASMFDLQIRGDDDIAQLCWTFSSRYGLTLNEELKFARFVQAVVITGVPRAETTLKSILRIF